MIILPEGVAPKVFEYHGISFRQNPSSPDLLAFVASANELAQFCGVARKSEQFLGNYQRALDTDRVTHEVAPFFQDPQNCSPTAIVLSLQETPLCEISIKDVSAGSAGVTTVVKTLKIIYVHPEDLNRETILACAKSFLDQRLATDAAGPEEATEPQDALEPTLNDEEDTDEELATDEEEIIDQANGEDEGTVELGQSILRSLRTAIDDPASITDELYGVLVDMLKPALVIDGQHRLFGAAKVEENIPLLVCSLVEPEWKEQVFQFTVINDKAKGIPKPFITSLAGMSLTPTELTELSARLDQAGIRLWEVEVMQRLGYAPESPFYKMIDFNTGGKSGKGLGYQTMKKAARMWYEAKPVGLLYIAKKLYTTPGMKKPASRKPLVTQWQITLDWFAFFLAFWDRVKDKFAPKDLWQVHSNLMVAVVLEQFQHSFFKYLRQTKELAFEPIEEADATARREKVLAKFKELVDLHLKKFDAKNFEKEWQIKSLNHKSGRELLEGYFDNIVDGKPVALHPLVAPKAQI